MDCVGYRRVKSLAVRDAGARQTSFNPTSTLTGKDPASTTTGKDFSLESEHDRKGPSKAKDTPAGTDQLVGGLDGLLRLVIAAVGGEVLGVGGADPGHFGEAAGDRSLEPPAHAARHARPKPPSAREPSVAHTERTWANARDSGCPVVSTDDLAPTCLSMSLSGTAERSGWKPFECCTSRRKRKAVRPCPGRHMARAKPEPDSPPWLLRRVKGAGSRTDSGCHAPTD
jgi:hypothetical protein